MTGHAARLEKKSKNSPLTVDTRAPTHGGERCRSLRPSGPLAAASATPALARASFTRGIRTVTTRSVSTYFVDEMDYRDIHDGGSVVVKEVPVIKVRAVRRSNGVQTQITAISWRL